MDSEIVNGLFALIGFFLGWGFTFAKYKLERKDKFRMAAIEKRLEAHQKAYAQFNAIIEILDEHNKQDIKRLMFDTRRLLSNYSLYLEKGTRKQIVEVLGLLNVFCSKCDDIDNSNHPEKRERAFKSYTNVIDGLEKLGFLIQKEVELEPIAMDKDKLKFEN